MSETSPKKPGMGLGWGWFWFAVLFSHVSPGAGKLQSVPGEREQEAGGARCRVLLLQEDGRAEDALPQQQRGFSCLPGFVLQNLSSGQ